MKGYLVPAEERPKWKLDHHHFIIIIIIFMT